MSPLDGHAVLTALGDAPHRPAVVVRDLLKTAPAEHVIAAIRAAAGTASLSPDLLTRLTQALRRPSPPDPFRPLTASRRPSSPSATSPTATSTGDN